MKNFKSLLFLLLCAAFGYALTFTIRKAYLAWEHGNYSFEHHQDSPLTGVGDAPPYHGFTLITPPNTAALPKLFDSWRNLWATAVGIRYSPAWTRDLLVATAKIAHARNFTVVLLPPPTGSGTNPYPRELSDIAADAQAAKIDALCISWLNVDPDPAYWHQQATAIRATFTGKLILAATPAVFSGIDCWDVADYAGVAGPIMPPRRLPHASDDVTVRDFRATWDAQLTSLESLGQLQMKPVALLNMEIPPNLSFKRPAPGAAPAAMPDNPALQSTVYEALLTETKGRSVNTAFLMLNWGDPSDRASANNVPGLLPIIAAAWDPKKPRPAETVPADAPDPPEPDPTDLNATTTTTAPN